jgi:fatty acid desaturase
MSALTFKEFAAARKTLHNRRGDRYQDLLKQIRTPNYRVVWRDILLGHATIGATIVALALLPNSGVATAGFGIAGALVIGAALHYLLLFFHEASHYLIAPNKKLNDRLTDICIGALLLYPVAAYREVHFAHHRNLGTPEDPERSYFNPLTSRFLIESLCGIRALRTLCAHRAGRDRKATGRIATAILLGTVLHGVLLATAIFLKAWPLLVAWCVGVGMVFPAVSAVRQLLEHRDIGATGDAQRYTVEPHGEILRSFDSGILTRIIGAAGFDRHAIHHLEPQISYQYLPALEAFLLETDLAERLSETRISYDVAWRHLYAPTTSTNR